MKPKILFCTINGIGLGHIARGINIAKELRRIMPCDILFATNASFTKLFEEADFSFIAGGMNSAEVYNHKVPLQKYLDANDRFFSSVARKFNPQIMIFDVLIFPDSLAYAKKNNIFTAYVLREVKNLRYFLNFKKFLPLFDSVLLASVEEQGMINRLGALGFNTDKINYVGPIFRQPDEGLINEVKNKYKIKEDEFLITITGGGGAGGGYLHEVSSFYLFLDKLSKALGAGVKKKIRWILIRGPLALFKPDKLRNIEVYDFEYNMPELFKVSNLVVAVGGYNSLNEILCARSPAVFYALPSSMDDQERRILLYQEKGLITELNVQDFTGSLRLFKECISPRYARRVKANYNSYSHKNAARNAAALIIRSHQKHRGAATALGILQLYPNVKTENFITEEINHLFDFKPHYFCGSPKNSDTLVANYTCEPCTLRQRQGVYYPLFSNSSLKKFNEALLSCKIKVFYAEFLSDVVTFFPFIRKLNIPVIANFRGYELSDPKTVKYLSVISRLSRRIIARSNFQKNALLNRGIPQEKVRVVHSGINLDKIPFVPRIIDPTAVRLLSAGRFVEKKGFDITIDFFKIVLVSYPKATLTIIGEGGLEGSIMARINKEGLTDTVKVKSFLPHADFIKELYRQDIFVLACKTAANGDQEGIPNVLKEAMASGMAVISTVHAGIPELIEDEVTGFLAKENSPEDLYKKFKWILDCPKEVERVNLNARFFVEENFDIKQTSRQVGAIIKQELAPEHIRNIASALEEGPLDDFLNLFKFGEYLYRYQARMMANYSYGKIGFYHNKVKKNILLREESDFLKLPVVHKEELKNSFPQASPKNSTHYSRMAACFLSTGLWKIGDPWIKLAGPQENILKLSSKQIKSIYRQVTGSGSRLFYVNPTYLKLLLYCFRKEGLLLKGKYAVISTGEVLLPSTLKLIQKYLDCDIYDQYGCPGIGPVSITCKNNASHIFSKSVYVEVIPEKELARPDLGKVVITDLENRLTPFVRYFTGDYAYIPECKECSCDIRTPILGRILGSRKEAVFYLGRPYFPLDFDDLFIGLENILMYQIIFKKKSILIKIVLEDVHLKIKLSVIEERIKWLLGSKIEPVIIENVDYIPLARREKYRSVVVER